MPLSDYQLSIGGVVIGPSTDYIIHSVEGLGVNEVRSGDTPRPQQHGDYWGTDTIGSRTVTLDLTVRGDTADECQQNADALLAQWWLRQDETIRALNLKLPGRDELTLLGRPRRAAADTSRLLGRRIRLTLEYQSKDAAVYAATETVQTTGLSSTTTGRTYNRTYPLSYGGGVSNIISVNNAGNFDTWPTLRITGPVTNPAVEHIETGRTLTFSITLASGDYLDVNCEDRTVLLGGTANRRSTLLAGSAWIYLPPGASSLRFSGSSFTGVTQLQATYRSAWVN